jgi:hypothetical protein
MDVVETWIPGSDALQAALLRLLEASAKRRMRSQADTALVKAMREAAHEICGGIQAVCNSGGTVVAHSKRSSHRTHEIRKVGVLCNDTVLTYSPSAHAPSCDHNCILSDVDRLEVVADATPLIGQHPFRKRT